MLLSRFAKLLVRCGFATDHPLESTVETITSRVMRRQYPRMVAGGGGVGQNVDAGNVLAGPVRVPVVAADPAPRWPCARACTRRSTLVTVDAGGVVYGVQACASITANAFQLDGTMPNHDAHWCAPD